MNKGRCHLSLVPMRAEPSDRSEQVNQLLFGDTFEILEEQDKWSLVKLDFDAYEGWIDNLQYQSIDPELKDEDKLITTDLMTTLSQGKNQSKLIYAGSTLSKGDLKENAHIKICNSAQLANEVEKRNRIAEFAQMFLGASYLWGGRSIAGIDCSGFSQLVFKMIGLKLMRDASLQATQGILLNFLVEAKTGDLAFFDNEEGVITHVGILLDQLKIIHASGEVRVDLIDHQGIYNHDQQKYTHQLRFIRSMI